jgi:hypothetical protein
VKQKSVGASRTQVPQVSSSAPGVVQKLKSERVQLRTQTPAGPQRQDPAVSTFRLVVGAEVVVSFALTGPEVAAPPGNVEAGSASGTPGQNRQPSTVRKEVDHEESDLVR